MPEACRQVRRKADYHKGKEDADRQNLSRVLESSVHPRAGPAVLARKAVHQTRLIGARNSEGQVPRPVDRGGPSGAKFLQPEVGPKCAGDPKRHRDKENHPPIDRPQYAAEDEASLRPWPRNRPRLVLPAGETPSRPRASSS